MIRIKLGVQLDGVRPELIVGLLIADCAYARRGVECVITSVKDGHHMLHSLHYLGLALDLSIRDVLDPVALTEEIAACCGADFDVVLESTHIHMEYQP